MWIYTVAHGLLPHYYAAEPVQWTAPILWLFSSNLFLASSSSVSVLLYAEFTRADFFNIHIYHIRNVKTDAWSLHLKFLILNLGFNDNLNEVSPLLPPSLPVTLPPFPSLSPSHFLPSSPPHSLSSSLPPSLPPSRLLPSGRAEETSTTEPHPQPRNIGFVADSPFCYFSGLLFF